MINSDRISDKEVLSHIQMPKCVLKRFHNQKHHFFYYDIQNNFIGTNGTAKSFNTKRGYYSLEMEQYLSESIETPFGRILTVVDRIDFEKANFIMPSDFERTTKSFMYALMARDPYEIEDTEKNMIYSQFFFSKQMRHDYLAKKRMEIADKKEFLADYILTFMVNKTDVPFVLPIAGTYGYKMGKYRMINLPVTPEIALCLVRIEDADDLVIEENKISVLEVTSLIMVKKINEKAFESQKKRNYGWVICPYREELDRLKTALIPTE